MAGKITEMTETTAPAATDLVEITINPGTTPATRKSTLANVAPALAPSINPDLVSDVAATTNKWATPAQVKSALGAASISDLGTPATGDQLMVRDVSASNGVAYIPWSSITSTAIASIIPGTTNTINLGDGTHVWANGYFTNLFAGGNVVLTDASGTTLTAKTSPTTSDNFFIFDAAASDAPKVSTGANVITGLGLALSLVTRNAQTGTTYTLALSDASKIITLDNTSAITLTIPTNAAVAFPVGTVIVVRQANSGTVTITASSGVTLQGVTSPTVGGAISGQRKSVALEKSGTDTWSAYGSIGTVT